MNNVDDADAGEGGSAAPPEPHERNRAPDLTREYRSNDIVVHWYAKRCIHSAACIMRAPRVFDPQRRPWIDLERGSFDEIKAAVEACPTGALEYLPVDGNAVAEPDTTDVKLVTDGPLLLRGHIRILAEDGTVLREGRRVALCRCGKSRNKPFCDNSHRAD